MANINITLDTIDKVRNFVNAVSRLEGEYDLISGRYIVDAKSIMGIFSLDLSKPLELQVHDPAMKDAALEALKPFLTK